jgi:MFS family permease
LKGQIILFNCPSLNYLIINRRSNDLNLKLLKNRSFTIILISDFINVIGNGIQSFALALYVLTLTGSATKFASVCAVAIIPRIVIGPFAGVLVDWYDRKKMIVLLDLINGGIVLIFVVIFKQYGCLNLIQIYILTLGLAITSIFYNPAIGTVIPSVLSKEDLLEGNSLKAFIQNSGRLIAPTLAGMILSFTSLYIIMVVNVVSFFIASALEMLLVLPNIKRNKSELSIKSFKEDLINGFRFMKNNENIMCVSYLALILNFAFSGMAYIGYIYICKKVLYVSDFQYGLFETVSTFSMVVSPLIIKLIGDKLKLGKLIFMSMFSIAWIVGIISFTITGLFLNLFNGNLVPYVIFMSLVFMMGVIALIVNIGIDTMFEKEVPLEMLGRVGTLIGTIATLATPLGQMLFGILFDKLPTWLCVFIVFIMVLVTILKFRRTLYSFDSRSEDKYSDESIELT